jgi:hypothetical protein
MADVFVSYAHQDREWVSLFTERLRQAAGFDIWWDRTILPGEQFDDVIQAALNEARRVIVVWSVQSVPSRWVRTEAREAAQRDVLLPVRMDDVVLPLEFRSFETADLSKWQGDTTDPQFLEIVEALRSGPVVRTTQPAAGLPATSGVPRTGRRRTPLYWWVAGVTAILVLVTLFVLVGRRPPERPPASVENTSVRTTTTAALMPQFTYGTWTIHRAIDDEGKDWSNSVMKFETQAPADGGLTVTGTFTWRLQNVLIGSEAYTGHYIAATRQLILEGESVTDAGQNDPPRLAVGSYSAIVSADGRSLADGRWGSTSKSEPGVAGHWEATR